MALRASFVLALILGIIFWTGHEPAGLVSFHMLLGFVVVASAWYLGYAAWATGGGNQGLAGAAFVIGLLVLLVGLSQTRLLVGSAHGLIQGLHLLLGLAAVGIGEVAGGRLGTSASPTGRG